jgi:AraC-like DNA-binding protein
LLACRIGPVYAPAALQPSFGGGRSVPLPSTDTDDLPLTQFAAVDTRDPDRAREEVGRIFCEHRLAPLGAQDGFFHARHRSARGRGFSVNAVAYGARVEIDPGCLGSFFLLQIPLRGRATVRCGTRLVEAGPQCASLLSPTLPTRMTWEAGCGKLIVLLDRERMERHLAQLLDGAPRVLEFDPEVDLNKPAGAAVRSTAALMLHAAETRCSAHAVLDELATSLAGILLACVPHGATERLGAERRSPASPTYLRRAEAYIRANLDAPLSLTEIAAAAGASPRSVQEAFRRFRETTVTDYVREARLRAWHGALETGTEDARVTDLALCVGFSHLGRAAAYYRARFGEAPSETLGRARRRG